MNTKFNIIIGSDHGAAELHEMLAAHMRKAGYNVIDAILEEGKTDYPDVAAVVATAILEGRAERGVLLCGTGIGISMAANRYIGIRAALCHDEYTARLSRQHNDANILAMGGRTTGVEVAKAMLSIWLETEFEGGRHIPRIEKIEKYARELQKSD